jgi:hypothetical protein
MYKVKFNNQILGECYLINKDDEFHIDPIVLPIINGKATLSRYVNYANIVYFKTKKAAEEMAKEAAKKEKKEKEIEFDSYEVVKVVML